MPEVQAAGAEIEKPARIDRVLVQVLVRAPPYRIRAIHADISAVRRKAGKETAWHSGQLSPLLAALLSLIVPEGNPWLRLADAVLSWPPAARRA